MTNKAKTEQRVQQYLSFKLNGEIYGVNILRVQEIKEWENTTPIPNTPDFVKGVLNLRGTVIPIIDLRIKFDMQNQEFTNNTVIIVTKIFTNDVEKVMGLVVDSVSDTQNIEADDISEAPDLGSKINTNYIKGICSANDKMLIILDIDQLINHGVLDSLFTLNEEKNNG